MEIVKFTVGGRCGMFTNNAVNSFIATYPHIHKVAVLGLLGSIIGITKNENNPKKFYDDLNSLRIGIVPHKIRFNLNRSTYTNTTGHFNKNGSTYVCEYDELINPSWDIYIENSNDNQYYDKIKDFLINKKAYFLPYLGRNIWFAKISQVEILDGIYLKPDEAVGKKISGIFVKDKNILMKPDSDKEIDFLFGGSSEERINFEFILPTGLNNDTGCYIQKNVCISNDKISKVLDDNLFYLNNKLIYLF